jgi:hypothetical protein
MYYPHNAPKRSDYNYILSTILYIFRKQALITDKRQCYLWGEKSLSARVIKGQLEIRYWPKRANIEGGENLHVLDIYILKDNFHYWTRKSSFYRNSLSRIDFA